MRLPMRAASSKSASSLGGEADSGADVDRRERGAGRAAGVEAHPLLLVVAVEKVRRVDHDRHGAVAGQAVAAGRRIEARLAAAGRARRAAAARAGGAAAPPAQRAAAARTRSAAAARTRSAAAAARARRAAAANGATGDASRTGSSAAARPAAGSARRPGAAGRARDAAPAAVGARDTARIAAGPGFTRRAGDAAVAGGASRAATTICATRGQRAGRAAATDRKSQRDDEDRAEAPVTDHALVTVSESRARRQSGIHTIVAHTRAASPPVSSGRCRTASTSRFVGGLRVAAPRRVVFGGGADEPDGKLSRGKFRATIRLVVLSFYLVIRPPGPLPRCRRRAPRRASARSACGVRGRTGRT